jgi:hypothetical protein
MPLLGTGLLLLAIAQGLAGCGAMPAHSNTLVFGTTTRVAVDVSQEPTGALGVTIGYKRNEAVWMPLIANVPAPTGGMQPAACTSEACAKLVGNGDEDTYSVLATFSGDMGGAAKAAEAKGTVSQFFATGLAARTLAQRGGAALVNTAAAEPLDADVAAAAKDIQTAKSDRITSIVDSFTRPDKSLDVAGVASLVAREPARSRVTDAVKSQLVAVTTVAGLEAQLRRTHQGYVRLLFDSLPTK